MFWYLLLSAIAAGIIATSVMVGMLYIPLLWGGKHFDVLGALGSAVTRQDDGRARVLGALLYYAGGLLFSLLYGWAALALLTTSEPVPQWLILRGPPVTINFFFPFLGAVIGFAHGIVVGLLLVIVIIEYHPLPSFQNRYNLVASQVVSHVVYGLVVMFFNSQFLRLFLGLNG